MFKFTFLQDQLLVFIYIYSQTPHCDRSLHAVGPTYPLVGTPQGHYFGVSYTPGLSLDPFSPDDLYPSAKKV